ncbi:MAG: DUF1003 domain-containing protein [Bacteroidetes bacterium]|nr:DUF1003 domain-containing protein [Bacteroidota bacterium]
MKTQDKKYLEELLDTENMQLERLHEIVRTAIQEEDMVTSMIEETNQDKDLSFGQRLSDRVAQFGGSWTFIISFMLVLFGWIALNSFVLTNRAFDPYPYILLNLILSCIAAIQAPVIMMSQNRKEAKDRQRAENDYMVNLKSEIEIRNLHRKMDLNMEDQFQHLFAIQQKQLELMELILNKIDKK